MPSYAVLFPGQGSQHVGMASELWEHEIFSRASDVLGWDVVRLCREGPEEELQRTENAQPALFVAGFASWKQSGLDDPAFVAGHSLGEYTAVAAVGALGFEDALALVAERGRAMAAAASEHLGEMAALLGTSLEEAEELCAARDSLWVANDNAPGQVVVGGSPEDIEWVTGQVRRARRLAVSGAFHTPFMAPAAERLRKAIDEVGMADARTPVVCNVDAEARTGAGDLADSLKRQLTCRVRFRESVRGMADQGVDTFYCAGPGDAVAGMVRRIAPDAHVKGVTGS